MDTVSAEALSVDKPAETRRWPDVLGAWLGIGTAPGALIVGAGMAARHGGAVPIFSVLLSVGAMFAVVWLPGLLGVNPPHGEGLKLTDLTPKYFSPGMQRALAGLIALGMTGWFGFNVGLGGAALSALIEAPGFVGPLLIGIPVLIFSLLGIKRWNGLAVLTTAAVIVLVVMVSVRFAGGAKIISFSFGDPANLVVDMATLIGYLAVFAVRSPDFTAGFTRKKDLVISNLLLCVPIILIALAGVGLQQGTGSADLVSIMAQPGGLKIGNLLIFLAVIAPALTILYSGAPALKASVGLKEKYGMYLITAVGLTLAITRFDLLLIDYLGYLAALMPPVVIPLAVEAARRRRGGEPRMVSVWVWLPGAAVSVILTIFSHPMAALAGLLVAAAASAVWVMVMNRKRA
jgi:hypothetical protein